MNANLVSIDTALRRILELLEAQAQPKLRTSKKVELTDAEWLHKMVEAYPNFDVPQLLRDAEAHYLSSGRAMTRAKGAAWLKRQAEWHKPVTAPAKKRGLVL